MKDKYFGNSFNEIKRYHRFFMNEKVPYDIGMMEYFHLIAIYGENGVTQDYLSKKLGFDKASSAKAMKKLSSLGFVVREKNPKDKRAYIISITDKGADAIAVINRTFRLWHTSILEGIDEEDYRIFLKVINRIKENAKRLAGK
ncbi:MAG: hypothetical protein CSB16_00680 [Clostridiales bacterium]|nr:MAG: hypothetical protein CSB16_00680 [Clostridiales bacterium]